MQLLTKHWPRILVTLIPLVLALLHTASILPLTVLQRLDDIIYDTRLRGTMPKSMDDRIVRVSSGCVSWQATSLKTSLDSRSGSIRLSRHWTTIGCLPSHLRSAQRFWATT